MNEKMLLRALVATSLVMMFLIICMAIVVAQRPTPSCGVTEANAASLEPRAFE